MTAALAARGVVDGSGTGPYDGVVLITGDRLEGVEHAPTRKVARRNTGSVDLGQVTILPGLIDAHSHVGLVGFSPPGAVSAAVIAGRIFENCRLALDAGFTTLRDLGGVDGGIVEAISLGLVRGPRLLPAGPMLSESAGHGDRRGRYSLTSSVPEIPGLVQPSVVCDGPDAVRKSARLAFLQGATQLKVSISGGAHSPIDLISDCQFSVQELHAAVEVAQARHTYVTAHAHHSEAILNGLAAGVECFEHGTFLDVRTVRAMAAAGASLVATLGAALSISDSSSGPEVPAQVLSTRSELFATACESLKTALESGVRVGSGSDLVGANQNRRGREISVRAMVTSPLEAIGAATGVNASILRLGNELGRLAPGLSADLIVVDGDPCSEPQLLDDPQRVRLVVLRGVIRKNTLPEPWAAQVSDVLPSYSSDASG